MVSGIRLRNGSQEQETHLNPAQRIRDVVSRIGAGKATPIEVRLKGKTFLRGYVREAGENSFVAVDSKTGSVFTVPYQEVKKIRKEGFQPMP